MVTATARLAACRTTSHSKRDFGPERTQYWHGVDFTLNARLRQGLIMQFGTATGRSVEDTCEMAA